VTPRVAEGSPSTVVDGVLPRDGRSVRVHAQLNPGHVLAPRVTELVSNYRRLVPHTARAPPALAPAAWSNSVVAPDLRRIDINVERTSECGARSRRISERDLIRETHQFCETLSHVSPVSTRRLHVLCASLRIERKRSFGSSHRAVSQGLCTSAGEADGQPERITEVDRIPTRIPVGIEASVDADGVGLRGKAP